MKNTIIIILTILSLVSCTSIPALAPVASSTSSGPRTIILDGETFSDEINGFTSWYGVDFINGGKILVEVGFFNDPYLEGFGFILYDGGYIGTTTIYQREGLEHRWAWGTDLNYSFVIKSDETGLYYDFSSAKDDEKVKPSEIYQCYKRVIQHPQPKDE